MSSIWWIVTLEVLAVGVFSDVSSVTVLSWLRVGEGVREPPSGSSPHALSSSSMAVEASLCVREEQRLGPTCGSGLGEGGSGERVWGWMSETLEQV